MDTEREGRTYQAYIELSEQHLLRVIPHPRDNHLLFATPSWWRDTFCLYSNLFLHHPRLPLSLVIKLWGEERRKSCVLLGNLQI